MLARLLKQVKSVSCYCRRVHCVALRGAPRFIADSVNRA